MRTRPFLRALSVVAGLLALGPSTPARAESGSLNLHIDLGVGAPIAGPARPGGPGDATAAGGVAFVGLDWQPRSPWAMEALLGFGGFAKPIAGSGLTGTRFVSFGLGARLRLLDDGKGYLNQPGGNPWGNLWVSAHLGGYGFDGPQLGVDLAVGYELSVRSPLQLGAFVRTALMFGGDDAGQDMILVGGLSLSFELLGPRGAPDADGDGLSDDREAELGTDPSRSDTDGDGLRDAVEVESGTDPTERDTDRDGMDDDDEDRNRNGRVDEGETDPRNRDTDGGGMADGEEARTRGFDPLDPHDDDRDGDGVVDPIDACPNTPEGVTVAANGCPTRGGAPPAAAAGARIQLAGVQFASGSATLLPESEEPLQEALRFLQAEPALRVEIGGHTDAQGDPRTNLRLSRDRARAVMEWLIDHGVDRRRLQIRGYGSAQPIAPNDTAEGRSANRRIEFRRLSE